MQQIALTLTKILHHKVGDQDALLINRNLAWARTSALGRNKESLHTEIIIDTPEHLLHPISE